MKKLFARNSCNSCAKQTLNCNYFVKFCALIFLFHFCAIRSSGRSRLRSFIQSDGQNLHIGHRSIPSVGIHFRDSIDNIETLYRLPEYCIFSIELSASVLILNDIELRTR